MSLRDGDMRHEHLYLTSDLRLAAYLLLRGFELLGAVDNGNRRKEFGLTHTNPHILEDMEKYVRIYADEFENYFFETPNEPVARVSFRQYTMKLNELHKALDEAIKR